MLTNLNSILIRAREPVLVDTGMVTNREQWFEDVFSLIQPNEVRWIFVTHDDCDHTGNLVEALKRCPNAMVVTNKAASWRTAAAFGIPHERIRTVNNGETFNLGDRTFRAIRPPVFDSPYMLGLFDTTTRVYYASDAFCSPMPIDPVDLVDEMPALFWAEGMAKYHHTSLCPWIALVDPAKFQAEINKVVGLGIKAIAGAHTPVIPETSVQQAFGLLASVPFNVAPPLNLDGVGVSLVTPSSET
jgi:flavorubredoxin